jgi:hypothetical protein
MHRIFTDKDADSPDDTWNEDEAMEALQSVTNEGLTWELHDGEG